MFSVDELIFITIMSIIEVIMIICFVYSFNRDKLTFEGRMSWLILTFQIYRGNHSRTVDFISFPCKREINYNVVEMCGEYAIIEVELEHALIPRYFKNLNKYSDQDENEDIVQRREEFFNYIVKNGKYSKVLMKVSTSTLQSHSNGKIFDYRNSFNKLSIFFFISDIELMNCNSFEDKVFILTEDLRLIDELDVQYYSRERISSITNDSYIDLENHQFWILPMNLDMENMLSLHQNPINYQYNPDGWEKD